MDCELALSVMNAVIKIKEPCCFIDQRGDLCSLLSFPGEPLLALFTFSYRGWRYGEKGEQDDSRRDAV